VLQQTLNAEAQEWQRRLMAATDAGDATLTAEPAITHLDRLRLHIGLAGPLAQPVAGIAEGAWYRGSEPTSGPALTGSRLRIRFEVSGIAESSELEVFIFGEIQGKALAPDITGIDALQRIYGTRNGNLDELERHGQRMTTVDEYIGRVKKQLSGVDADGRAVLTVDWRVPDQLLYGLGTLYPVCIAPAGTATTRGAATTEHTVSRVRGGSRIVLPHVHRTRWSLSAAGSGTSRINRGTRSRGFVIVETRALPAGTSIEIVVRDANTNQEILREVRRAPTGNGSTAVAVAAPDANAAHHASVAVTRTTDPVIELASGAGVMWID
jgi:hypothetical protein